MQPGRWTVKGALIIIVLGMNSMTYPSSLWAEAAGSSEESPSLQQQIDWLRTIKTGVNNCKNKSKGALQQGQQVIRDELKAIKELLTARTKRRSPIKDISVTLNVADARHAQGSPRPVPYH